MASSETNFELAHILFMDLKMLINDQREVMRDLNAIVAAPSNFARPRRRRSQFVCRLATEWCRRFLPLHTPRLAARSRSLGRCTNTPRLGCAWECTAGQSPPLLMRVAL